MRRVNALGVFLALMLALAACGRSGVTAQDNASSGQASLTSTSGVTLQAASCQPGQLDTQLVMGSPATGNLTGVLYIWNSSATACSVAGAVGFAGLDAQGGRIAGVKMNQPRTLASAILPPNVKPLPEGTAPTAGSYLQLTIIGAYRDDPTSANGACATADEITPASFVVTVGSVSVSAKNHVTQSYQGNAFYGCHGAILGEGMSLS